MFLWYAFFVGLYSLRMIIKPTSKYVIDDFPQKVSMHLMSFIEFTEDDFPNMEEPLENDMNDMDDILNFTQYIKRIPLYRFSGMDERFSEKESDGLRYWLSPTNVLNGGKGTKSINDLRSSMDFGEVQEEEIIVLERIHNYMQKKDLLEYLQQPYVTNLEKIQRIPSLPKPPILTVYLHAGGLMNDWNFRIQ